MSTTPGGMYVEDGQIWMRVGPGHSVSEQWLRDTAPDQFQEWWAAASPAARAQVASRIGRWLEENLAEVAIAPPAAVAAVGDTMRDRVGVEMGREGPDRAMWAEVVVALAAGQGGDIRRAIELVRQRGLDLPADVPALLPARDFVRRHRAALTARLEREMREGGFTDRPNYLASARLNRALSRAGTRNGVLLDWPRLAGPDLPDFDSVLVRHAVESVAGEIEGAPVRALRSAQSMYERAQDRVLVTVWCDALEQGEVSLTSQAFVLVPGAFEWQVTGDLDDGAACEPLES